MERRVKLLLLVGVRPEDFTQELLDMAQACIDRADAATRATGRQHYPYMEFSEMMLGPPRT